MRCFSSSMKASKIRKIIISSWTRCSTWTSLRMFWTVCFISATRMFMWPAATQNSFPLMWLRSFAVAAMKSMSILWVFPSIHLRIREHWMKHGMITLSMADCRWFWLWKRRKIKRSIWIHCFRRFISQILLSAIMCGTRQSWMNWWISLPLRLAAIRIRTSWHGRSKV